MVIANALRFRIALRGDVLEIRSLRGVRSITRADLASRRLLKTQINTYLELTFKDSRPPYQLPWLSSPGLDAFLKPVPDTDEQAAIALEHAVSTDDRLGATPEERKARFARRLEFFRNSVFAMAALWIWSYLYPHPYWLLVAVLIILPWICVLALNLFPGVLQLADEGNLRRPGSRPSVLPLLIAPIVLLALRASQDVSLLNWPAAVKWMLVELPCLESRCTGYWAGSGGNGLWWQAWLLCVLPTVTALREWRICCSMACPGRSIARTCWGSTSIPAGPRRIT